MRQITPVLAAAILAASVAACDEQTEIEPGADNAIVEAMPETPDRSETVADERAMGVETPGVEPTGEAQQPEPAPAY